MGALKIDLSFIDTSAITGRWTDDEPSNELVLVPEKQPKLATLFLNVKNTQSNKRLTFGSLVKMAASPTSLAKTEASVIAPHLCSAKTKSAVIASNAMTMLWVDIDTGNLSLNDVNRKVFEAVGANTVWLVYATYSSKPNSRRWRVLIPLDKPLFCSDWIEAQRALAGLCGGDTCAVRVQQILFAPNRGEHYESMYHEGQPLDSERISALLNKYDDHVHVAVDKVLQTRSAGQNKGFCIASVNAACDTEKLLQKYGYKRRGRKWLSPNSSSGTPGVHLFDDGRWYSHHSSDADIGLPCDGAVCGDAFDLICHYEYDSDERRALTDLAAQLDPEGQKQRQLEYMRSQSDEQAEQKKADDDFDFSKFSLRGQSMDLERKLLSEVYILEQMALLGEITVFFAPPNSGKTLITLRLLFDAVDNQKINGDNVFYINADDSLKGITTKLKLCEQHQIHMLAPGQNGFEVSKFVKYLEKMVSSGSAHGKVIILDTAKKFTSIMDKESSSKFNSKLREFSQAGGSVVLLAHTNKNRNSDGQLVAGGTSDLIDDADCAFIIDVLSDDGHTKTVVFQNQKRRGGCSTEVVFTYSSNPKNYSSLIDSVEMTDNPELAKAEFEAAKQRQKDSKTIAAINEALEEGGISKTELVKKVTNEHGISRRDVFGVLERYVGDSVESIADGKLWRIVKTGERNRKIIEPLKIKFKK